MNTQTENQSHRDGIVTAIGVLVLLIGTATGSAITLLVMSLIGIIVIPIFYRQQLRQPAWLVMIGIAAIAAVTAITLVMMT